MPVKTIPRGPVARLVGRAAVELDVDPDGFVLTGQKGRVELPFAQITRIRFGWKVTPIAQKSPSAPEPFVIRFWMRDVPGESRLYAIIHMHGAPRFRSLMCRAAEIVTRDWPSICVETGASWAKALPPAVLASLVCVAMIPLSVGFFSAIGATAGLVPAAGAVGAAFVARAFFRLLPRRVFDAETVAYHLLLSEERGAARRSRRGAGP